MFHARRERAGNADAFPERVQTQDGSKSLSESSGRQEPASEWVSWKPVFHWLVSEQLVLVERWHLPWGFVLPHL